MKRGATCLKKRRRVGKQQHTMKRFAVEVLSQCISQIQFVQPGLTFDNDPETAFSDHPSLVQVCKRRNEDDKSDNGCDHGSFLS
jgi:hypothetical protein